MSYQSFEDLESQHTCYICLDVCSEKTSFCKCKNSRCHQECIEKWASESGKMTCSICLAEYQVPLTPKNFLRFSSGICLEIFVFVVAVWIVYAFFGVLTMWAPDILDEQISNLTVRGAIVYHSFYTGYFIAKDFATHYFHFSWNLPVMFVYRLIYHTLYTALVEIYTIALARRRLTIPSMEN